MIFPFSKSAFRRSWVPALACLPVILAASPASPQSGGSATADVSPCIHIEDDDRRLRCFDRVTAHLRAQEPAASRREVPADARGSRQDDGYPIEATISSLREREPNQWLITLDNGQLWYQSHSKRIRLREGMEVRIAPSPLRGALRLSSEELQDFIQVDRVR